MAAMISLSALCLTASFSALPALPPLAIQRSPETARSLVIENVHVACPTSDAPLEAQRVVIQHGAIVLIQPMEGTAYSQAGPVLDGRGRYLAPGFYDMHTHLPGVDSYFPATFRDEALRLMLESGITTARVARGAPELLAVKAAIAQGDLVGPRLFVATPALRRDSFPPLETTPELFSVWKAQGYDAVKFLSGPPALEQKGHAAGAIAAGLRWYGHLPGGPVADWPLDWMASLEHASALERMVDRFPETTGGDLALLASNGVFVCPDLDWYYAHTELAPLEDLLAREGMDLLPEAVVKDWSDQRALPNPRRKGYEKTLTVFEALAPKLRAAGVELLVSPSDAPFCVPGKGYVIEAQHLAKAGYSAREVLRMATLNGARCQGEESLRGSVQVGRVADLVLLDADPFKSVDALGAVSAVIVDGTVVAGR